MASREEVERWRAWSEIRDCGAEIAAMADMLCLAGEIIEDWAVWFERISGSGPDLLTANWLSEWNRESDDAES